MPATINNPQLRNGLLQRHPAIASRLINENARIRPHLRWLAEPGSNRLPPADQRDNALIPVLKELIDPLGEEASPWECRQLSNTAEWLSAFARYADDCPSARELELPPRMLASCLLPLYRCLATHELTASLQAMRLQWTEHLALLGLIEELGGEFCQLLESQLLQSRAPHPVLLEKLSVDVTQLSLLMLDLVGEYDELSSRFSQSGRMLLCNHDVESNASREHALDWAMPKLLWQLAGELMATRSEMILPRPWVEVPIPWSKIQDHWYQLARLLEGSPNPIARELDKEPTAGEARASAATLKDPEAVQSPLTRWEGTISDVANALMDVAAGQEATLLEANPAVEMALNNQSSLAKVNELECELELALHKVILAEISTTSDPALVNVLKRRLSICRVEDRPMCLSVVVVKPDDDQVASTKTRISLNHWQQQLVNWIAEQPHVVDPCAFLTTQGELVLCLQDLEKNEMTSLIRRALLRVLGGDGDLPNSDATLSKVNIPARFHAGIAGTTSPGPNLAPEHLIAPALRCLNAAQHQSKAGIKSIEVY